MPLRLKVGRKGYVILPKAVREAVGIEEGEEVIVEIRGDGIVLRPVRKIDVAELRRRLRKHRETLMELPGRREPKIRELAGVSLEEEFE